MIIILPSNSPAVSYPDNKSSNYTIPLPFSLLTPSTKKWKVAIAQLYLPLTFYNFEKDESITLVDTQGKEEVFYSAEGVYKTRQKVCEMLSNDILTFKLNNEVWGFEFTLPTNYKEIKFTPHLAKLLGFKENLKPSDTFNRIFKSGWKYDPWVNFRTIYIMSNIAKGRQVGKRELRLLRYITPLNFQFGTTVSKSFFPLDWIEVEGEVHQTISIQVKDWTECPLKFRAGSVVIKLVFKHL